MSFSVVILSRDHTNLKPCIAAVRKHEPEARIIVVDDGVDWFEFAERGTFECDFEIVPGRKPFCYSRNLNIGIRAADSDVIALNDDALLETPGGFQVLEAAANQYPELGIIGATTNCVGNQNQLPRGIGLRTDDRMVCFICVYVPKRTIEKVGFMEERLKFYGCEDDDYGLRVRKAGLKIGIHDGCFVDHKSLHSSFRGPAGAGGDFRPNLEIFKQIHGCDNWGRPV